jgi:hypothetical protein
MNSNRDAGGRYASQYDTPANRCYRRIAEFRQVIIETVNKENVVKIVQKLIERAESGSETAAKLVLQYAVGKPSAAVDPDRADLDEWNLRTSRPNSHSAMVGLKYHPPMETSLAAGREMDAAACATAAAQAGKREIDAAACMAAAAHAAGNGVEAELKKMLAEERRKEAKDGKKNTPPTGSP